MKTVVITGSARGLGFELAKVFRKNNYNVVLSDIMEEKLGKAKENLENSIKSESKVIAVVCDVTKEADLQNLMDKTIEAFKGVDVWINNAGVNQPMIPIWEVASDSINRLIECHHRFKNCNEPNDKTRIWSNLWNRRLWK